MKPFDNADSENRLIFSVCLPNQAAREKQEKEEKSERKSLSAEKQLCCYLVEFDDGLLAVTQVYMLGCRALLAHSLSASLVLHPCVMYNNSL